jgi:hypothetical protein
MQGGSVQERSLSPRSIYFGERLTWECSELLANESFPQGSPGFKSIGIEKNGPLRLARSLYGLRAPDIEYANGYTMKNTYDTWLHLVEKYRHCNLTYTSDTLPALAGLARKFQKELNDEYLAGLWRTDILRGLLWLRCVEQCCKIADRLLDTYRGNSIIDTSLMLLTKRITADACIKAPSWSWAAADLAVKFMHLGDMHSPRTESFVAEVHSVIVTATSTITGPISHGCLTLSAILRPNKNMLIDAGAHSGFETFYYSGIPSCMDSVFLVMTYRTATEPISTRVRGLIVKATGNPDEYRRVGAFQLDPVERSEFADLDFENPEKQRITIV